MENELLKLNRAIKVPLYPTLEQERLILQTFGCCRFVWNQMLADEQEFYAATGKHFLVTPAKYKGMFPFLKEVDSLALCNEQLALKRAFTAFFSKESRRIANAYNAVCVEDLNLANLSRTLTLGKSTADNGFGTFRQCLKYKLEEQGKYYIVVDKWFPSSKTCHYCGCKHNDLALKDRAWICPVCGHAIERDTNAAVNIKREGLRQFYDQSA